MACPESIENRVGPLKRGIAAFSDPDYSVKRSSEERRLLVGLETDGHCSEFALLAEAEELQEVLSACTDTRLIPDQMQRFHYDCIGGF
ncbi:hypothetical protein [Endozoicomonas numazuensis]|uniref:Uncharacterized protein n=1 Tax=Endozoicomonas numazuensis TaxID=1137799 RepID=A0A081NJR0_9GAMM|nr:hypothetical protein [Endozoicomonas numazuensis]KEQ18683.1 hypothetical protein GZ78_00750 [Endozoicomonas numazuensis]